MKDIMKLEELPFSTRMKWLDAAIAKYDNVMFCPKCGKLLTGLHEQSMCFKTVARKEAYKLYKESLKKNVEPNQMVRE